MQGQHCFASTIHDEVDHVVIIPTEATSKRLDIFLLSHSHGFFLVSLFTSYKIPALLSIQVVFAHKVLV